VNILTFQSTSFTKTVSNTSDAESLVLEWMQKKEIAFFIKSHTKEELHIVCTPRGSAVIYANYNEPYVAMDASTTPVWSERKVTIHVGGQETVLFENIILTKSLVRQIARRFCQKGDLLPAVYWLKEGTEPR